jgi:hypothetical protein
MESWSVGVLLSKNDRHFKLYWFSIPGTTPVSTTQLINQESTDAQERFLAALEMTKSRNCHFEQSEDFVLIR